MDRHPTTRTWVLPPERDDIALPRTNLRALAARPGRFEHHLVAVARIGDVQLEHATASEPLYFAHANVSDEYAMPLSTGDALVDSFPFRVFLSDPRTGEDVARVNHRVDDLVLHPFGFLHWPGRLRPPFDPPPFPPNARRAVHSLVMCASRPTPPVERPLFIGREGDAAKAYGEVPVPFLLAPIASTAPGVVARVGHAALRIAEPPFAPPLGGYVLVIDADLPGFPGDLIFVPPGERHDGEGVRRALVFASDVVAAEPPPPSWDRVPDAPFDGSAGGTLPFASHGVHADALSDREVTITIADQSAPIPRYWLARMLFRLALHGYALGYVETYGGFFYDDREGEIALGLRGRGAARVARSDIAAFVASLYAAVRPTDYAEDLV